MWTNLLGKHLWISSKVQDTPKLTVQHFDELQLVLGFSCIVLKEHQSIQWILHSCEKKWREKNDLSRCKFFEDWKINLHFKKVHMFILWLNSHIHRLDFGVVILSFMRSANHSVTISYWSLKGRQQFRPNFFLSICLVSSLGMRVRMWANVDACQQNTNPMCKYLRLKIRIQCAFFVFCSCRQKITSHCYDCCWCRFKTKYPVQQ